ncbi:unknown protein [Seminavis robusta]|uniref:Uncharacterized protein n=1 Tax=Seminavis robusta TaxID=568900 RepID=A0A9N8E3C7_9STRA|nr:unknown protein [Seminavis robusta]|eukprot:Sro617_g176130.1 n/a (1048) ;mRNA; r:40240-43625
MEVYMGEDQILITSGNTRIPFHSIVDHTSTTSTSQEEDEFLLSITNYDGETFVFQMETQEDLHSIQDSISKVVAKAARASEACRCEPPNLVVAMMDESHTTCSHEDMEQVREMTRQMDRQAKRRRSRRSFASTAVGATSVHEAAAVHPRKATHPSFPSEKFRRSAAPQRTAPPHLVVEAAMPPPAEIEDSSKPPGAYRDPGPPIGLPLPQQSSPPIIIDYEEEEPQLSNHQEDPLIEASLVPDDDEEDQRHYEFQDERVVLVQAHRAGLSDYLQNRNLQIFIVGLICLFAIIIIVTVLAVVLATGNQGGGETNTPAPNTTVAPIPTVTSSPTMAPTNTNTTPPHATTSNYTPVSLSPTPTPLDIDALLRECNLSAAIISSPLDVDSYQSAGCFVDVDTLDLDQLTCGPGQAPLECSLRCPTRFFGIPIGTTTCRCFSQIKSDRIGLQECIPGSGNMDLFVNQSPRRTQCEDPMARAVVEFLLQQRSHATWGFDIVTNQWKESPFELYAKGCHTNVYDVTVLDEEEEATSTRETSVMDVTNYATQRRGERSVSILYEETSEISVLAEQMEILAKQVSGVADPLQCNIFFYLWDDDPHSKVFTTSAVKRLAKVEVTNFSEKTSFATFSPSFRQSLLMYLYSGFQKEMAFDIFDRYGSFAVVRSMMGAFMELRLPLESSQYDNTFDSIVHAQSCFEIATQEEASRLGFPSASGTIDDTTCSPNIIRALQELRSEYHNLMDEPATVGGETECQLNATECHFSVDISTSQPLTAKDKYPFEKLESCDCEESDYPSYIETFDWVQFCPTRTCRAQGSGHVEGAGQVGRDDTPANESSITLTRPPTNESTTQSPTSSVESTLPPMLPPPGSASDSPVTDIPETIPPDTNIPTMAGTALPGTAMPTTTPPGCNGVPHETLLNLTTPTDAGSSDGDTFCEDLLGIACMEGAGFQTFNSFQGLTSQWFQAEATVGSRCNRDIKHRVTLEVPEGVNYDLKVYQGTQTNLYDSSTHGGGIVDDVTIVMRNAGYSYFVFVEFVGGSSCQPWTLTFEHFSC